MPNLYIEKVYPDAQLPQKQTDHAACYDLYAYLKNQPILIYNHKNEKSAQLIRCIDQVSELAIYPTYRALVPVGLKVCCDPNYKIQITIRSGTALKKGLTLANGIGVIDADYRNQLYAILINNSENVSKINHGERIAQMELIQLTPTEIIEGTLPLTNSNRTGGFNSTGI